MTFVASTTLSVTATITIAEHVPPEVLDSGKVRMGAGIRIDWIAWELMHRLLQIWTGAGG